MLSDRVLNRLWLWSLGIVIAIGTGLLIVTRIAYAQTVDQSAVEPTLVPRMLVSPVWFDFMSITGLMSLIGLAVHWGRSTEKLRKHGEDIKVLLDARSDAVRPEEITLLRNDMERGFTRLDRTLERLFPILGREQRRRSSEDESMEIR